jgi:hypothetical protein
LINLVQLRLARLLCYNPTPSLPDASDNSSAKPRQPKQKAKLICISCARCLSIHPDDDRTIKVGELPYHCPPLPPSPAVMGSSEPSRRPRVSSYFSPFPSCVPLSSLCRGISNHFLPNPNPSPLQNKCKEYAAPLTAAPVPSSPKKKDKKSGGQPRKRHAPCNVEIANRKMSNQQPSFPQELDEVSMAPQMW